jgi:hypothetical protein
MPYRTLGYRDRPILVTVPINSYFIRLSFADNKYYLNYPKQFLYNSQRIAQYAYFDIQISTKLSELIPLNTSERECSEDFPEQDLLHGYIMAHYAMKFNPLLYKFSCIVINVLNATNLAVNIPQTNP